MKHMAIAAGAIAALALSLGSAAQETAAPAATAPAPKAAKTKKDAPPPLAERFAAIDKDGDGKVSYEDVKSVMPKFPWERFDRLDKNQDGYLERSELPRPKPAAAASPAAAPDAKPASATGGGQQGSNLMALLKEADTNGDGKISPEEFKAARPKAPADRFALHDRNKDGYISPADMGSGNRGGGRARGAEAPASNWPELRDALIARADADKDGKVTYEELLKVKPGMPRDAFRRFDTNGDGTLSADDPAPTARPAAPAAGARGGEDGRNRMRAADTDGDGKVSKEEAMKAFPNLTEEAFKARDRDGDGYLTPADRPPRANAPGV